jgi:hypothetical protein
MAMIMEKTFYASTYSSILMGREKVEPESLKN